MKSFLKFFYIFNKIILRIYCEDIDEDISVEGIIRDFGNETKRINISVQANFLDIVDNYAKEHHISRSALFQKATLDYMAS